MITEIRVIPADLSTKGVVIKKLSELINIEPNSNTYTINSIIDLGGIKIKMPKNTEIFFRNGNIKNGIIEFNNNTLTGNVKFTGCHIEGNITNSVIDMSWFKYDKNFKDVNEYIYELLDLAKGKELRFEENSYIEIPVKESNNKIFNEYNYCLLLDNKYNHTTINLNNSTIKILPNEKNIYSGIILYNTIDITIKNGTLKGEIDREFDKTYICEDNILNLFNTIDTNLDNLEITDFHSYGIKTDLIGKEIKKFTLIPGEVIANGTYNENSQKFSSLEKINKDWLLGEIKNYLTNNDIKKNIENTNWMIIPENYQESYEKLGINMLFSFYNENTFVEQREFNMWEGLDFYSWNEFPENSDNFRLTLNGYEEEPDFSSLKLLLDCKLNLGLTINNCDIHNFDNIGISLNYTKDTNINNININNGLTGLNNEYGINIYLNITNGDFKNLEEGLNLSTLEIEIVNSDFSNDSNRNRMILSPIYSVNELMNNLLINNSTFTHVDFNNAGNTEINNSDFTNSVISMGRNGDKYYFKVNNSSLGWWNAVKNVNSGLNLWYEINECTFMRELSPENYHYDWTRNPYTKILR